MTRVGLEGNLVVEHIHGCVSYCSELEVTGNGISCSGLVGSSGSSCVSDSLVSRT